MAFFPHYPAKLLFVVNQRGQHVGKSLGLVTVGVALLEVSLIEACLRIGVHCLEYVGCVVLEIMPYQGVPVISVHVGRFVYFAQSIAKLEHLVVFHFEQHGYLTVAIVDYFT